jgi:flagellar biosynthesis chaperone FliJ
MIEKKIAVLGIAIVSLIIAGFAIHTLYYTPMIDSMNSTIDTQQDTVDNQQNQLDSKNTQISNLSSTIDTQQDELDSKNTQISNLNTQIANLQSQIESLQSYANAQNEQLHDQIESLQSQLVDAVALITQLQGPTGILPTYMDLGWVGPDLNNGDYFLQLSLKNTGAVPINQIFVTINSVSLPMTFNFLTNTVSASTPLPPYETAAGIQDATPPVLHSEIYPLIIQAIASNGTIYTYQTTITSHV